MLYWIGIWNMLRNRRMFTNKITSVTILVDCRFPARLLSNARDVFIARSSIGWLHPSLLHIATVLTDCKISSGRHFLFFNFILVCFLVIKQIIPKWMKLSYFRMRNGPDRFTFQKCTISKLVLKFLILLKKVSVQI